MKKSILFVDDDPLLLQVYALMLESESEQWDMSVADSGEAAVKILSTHRFDVVVSDMRMPGMSGIQVMNEICRISPGTSRIIISGIDDQEEIARSMDSTHQFLAKPLRARDLQQTLQRIGNLDVYLQNNDLRNLARRLNSLPTFPMAYLQIMKELNSDEPSIEAIADIVSQDPGLTAKTLQVANSAAFGLPQSVSNPFDAVQFLGMGAIRSIALSAHVFANFEKSPIKGFPVKRVWEDALRCSYMTRLIMQMERAEENVTEDACTAAMLRGTGKLMLATDFPNEFQNAINLANTKQIALVEAEQEIFGATHHGIAAYLLGLWGLPAPMVEAVAFHWNPSASSSRAFSPLTVTHVAAVILQEMFPVGLTGRPAALDLPYLDAVGVNGRLEAWRAEIEEQIPRGQ